MGTFNRRLLTFLAFCGIMIPVVARAQTISADTFRWNTGPCVMRSGAGSPEGVVTATCGYYLDTTNRVMWTKVSGTGNTGWKVGFNAQATITSLIGTTITTPAATNLTLSPTGDVSFNPTGADVLFQSGVNTSSASYASQATGWAITNAGAGDFRYLFSDEMRIKILTADREQVLAGSRTVTKSYSTISQAFTCPAAAGTSTLWVADAPTFGDAAVFVSGDAIVIHTMTRTTFGPFTIADCVGVVTSYSDGSGANAGQQSWTFTRGSGGSAGTMTASTVVPVNELAVDYGVTGNGVIEETAVDGSAGVNAPYSQIKTWTTAPVAANFAIRTRIGKLTGITTVANEYGAIFGTFVAPPDENTQYVRVGTSGVNIVGADLAIFNSSHQPAIYMNQATPYFSVGSPAPSLYASGAGIWMGKDTATSPFTTFKFRVGDPSGAEIAWDGNALNISDAGLAIYNGATLTMYLNQGARQFTIGNPVPSAFGTGTGIWMGDDSGTYKFRVGDPSGNHIQWDGSALTIVGDLAVGSTATFGSGNEVTLDSNGITLASGSGSAFDANSIKWSGGNSWISSYVSGGNPQIVIQGGAGGTTLAGPGPVNIGGFVILSTLNGGGKRLVCTDNSGQLYAASGTTCP